MSGPPEPIDVAPEETADPFSRFAAIAIVVATLAGALVGFLESRASRGAALANLEAQRSLVRAMGGLIRADQAAHVDYHTFAVAEVLRHRAADAFQQSFLPGVEERRLELEQARLEETAERTQRLSDLSPEGPTGPEQDPTFPARFFSGPQREADRLWALADAANEEDAAWEGREATYTALLTMFAVAVYLLGLSLTLGERIRYGLAGLGVALIVVAGTWAGWLATHAPRRAPQEAAVAFADGRQTFFLATGPDGFRQAERHFTRAIELRPTFAQAYADRASATFLAGSSQNVSFASLSSPEAVESSTEDLRAALDLGLRTRIVLAELGFQTFVLGVQRDDPGLLEESVGFTRQAIELDPGDPILRYNLGVTLLARGEVEEARSAYAGAIRHTIFEDVEERTPQGNIGLQQQWVGGALTDLELLVANRPALAGEVRELKGLILGSAAAGEVVTVEPAEPAEPAPVAVDLFPSSVQWRGALPGFDPDRDVLAQQWYRETPEGWTSIPEVSGARTPGGSPEEWFSLDSYLTTTFPARCLPDGRYRVEIYASGRLIAEGAGEADAGDLEATVLRDLNVAMCRPADWEPSGSEVPGFLQGVVAPDERSGVYFFRFQHPGRIVSGDPGELTPSFVDIGVETFSELFPSPPAFDEPAGDQYFLGFDDSTKRWYTYGASGGRAQRGPRAEGGYVLGGAGVAGDGAVVVGLVFGPAEDFDEAGDPLLRVFDSLTEYQQLL